MIRTVTNMFLIAFLLLFILAFTLSNKSYASTKAQIAVIDACLLSNDGAYAYTTVVKKQDYTWQTCDMPKVPPSHIGYKTIAIYTETGRKQHPECIQNWVYYDFKAVTYKGVGSVILDACHAELAEKVYLSEIDDFNLDTDEETILTDQQQLDLWVEQTLSGLDIPIDEKLSICAANNSSSTASCGSSLFPSIEQPEFIHDIDNAQVSPPPVSPPPVSNLRS